MHPVSDVRSGWIIERGALVDGCEALPGERWYYVERGWTNDIRAAWLFPTKADAEDIQRNVGGEVTRWP